ncbi:MAG TPA: hypothetical protein VNF99_21605 [Stellaceae bacterium]|nr:hypothetical protein [Stellaceae bacterium]
MSDAPETHSTDLSRRSMIRKIAFTAGGGAILATGIGNIRMAEAQAAKASQKAVGYQATPHGAQQCDNCRQFIAPSSCKVVDGEISPTGWCKVYIKKPANT